MFHYSPDYINKKNEFKELGLPESWGDKNNYTKFLDNEIYNYINNKTYDPFAVCGALRNKIEEITYNKIQQIENKIEFLNTHTTRAKLEKADEFGIVSPESYYLLGVIYNEGMHWKDNQDNISPIASKLENMVIKKIIKDIF